MIGHHHEGDQILPLAVVVEKRIGHQTGNVRLCEPAGTLGSLAQHIIVPGEDDLAVADGLFALGFTVSQGLAFQPLLLRA